MKEGITEEWIEIFDSIARLKCYNLPKHKEKRIMYIFRVIEYK